jgi:hypothetical protein
MVYSLGRAVDKAVQGVTAVFRFSRFKKLFEN